MSPQSPNRISTRHRLKASQLRWDCDPAQFKFETTRDITQCPINIIGQPRALDAIELGLAVHSEGYNIFVSGQVGSGRSTVVRRKLAEFERGKETPQDLLFVHNFSDPDRPQRFAFPTGKGKAFRDSMSELIEGLALDLPKLFESETYGRRRVSIQEATAAAQKQALKDFEKRVQERGFALIQVQIGPAIAPQLLPVVAGNPTELDKLEGLVEQGQFSSEEFSRLRDVQRDLRSELDGVAKGLRNHDREMHRKLAALDRELAQPLIESAVSDVRSEFDVEGLSDYLDQLSEDLLERLNELREGPMGPAGPGPNAPGSGAAIQRDSRYQVNVVVDNSKTKGSPIIWETAPTYRNVFGTIDAVRSANGEWGTDHTRIKSGSLLRANGGILVLDAMDVLAEPGVWNALKRSLRTRRVEIQVFAPMHMVTGVSLKPEAAPINAKVLMIGTPFIYSLLYAHDEDFKKVFKVKAEFASHTPRSDAELENYACFVYKKINDDNLLHFHRDAVAGVVEEGVKLAGHNGKLTTRFKEIADLVRESAYWASKDKAEIVRATHVDRALANQAYRVNLLEELLRERALNGLVLLDLDGEKIGQVNGLAVLSIGDHAFAQPTRITATTAMGRNGIINIDREAHMSGRLHTKGVLILAGFLRERFAQKKPLTLTASLCFEQSYGPIDGDSASSTELYALISSLADLPVRQGVAVTGSVNQRGEIQPIGGVNEKIEGYFDLCKATGLTGSQGVLIPARNMDELMLRKDVVREVREGRFHVWAVSTIEEGLNVLTGVLAGTPDEAGNYQSQTVFGRANTKLTRFAEDVAKYYTAGGDPTV